MEVEGGQQTISLERRDEFARNGFIVLRDALDEELVERVREISWSLTSLDPDDPSTWGDRESKRIIAGWASEDQDGPKAFVSLNRRLHGLAECLVGAGSLADPTEDIQTTFIFPQEEPVHDLDATQPSDLDCHLDGYYNQGEGVFDPDVHEPKQHTIGASVYLGRVEPRGGGFTVWPGSHWNVAEFFETHTLAEGDYRHAYRHGSEHSFERNDPFEIAGDPGTVVLWHGKLEHCGGANLSTSVREAAFKRFQRKNIEETKHEAATSPFRFWEGIPDEYKKE